MPKENNKMQVDIDTLKKQNVNDLLSIKELYKRIEELGEKITQIKYIDSTLVKKLQKEYKKLNKIILDENIQVKLSNDIETINSQMDKIEKKIDYLYVEDFGAKGNGLTDDTLFFQNAIDYCSSNNIQLYLKSKKYLVNSTLQLKSNLYIEGTFGSEIYMPSSTIMKDIFSHSQNIRIKNLTIKNIKLSSANDKTDTAGFGVLSNVQGIVLNNCENILFQNIETDSLTTSFKVVNSNNNGDFTDYNKNIIIDNFICLNNGTSCYITSTKNLTLNNCIFEQSNTVTSNRHCVYIKEDVDDINIDKCKIKNAKGSGIHLYILPEDVSLGKRVNNINITNTTISDCSIALNINYSDNININNIKINNVDYIVSLDDSNNILFDNCNCKCNISVFAKCFNSGIKIKNSLINCVDINGKVIDNGGNLRESKIDILNSTFENINKKILVSSSNTENLKIKMCGCDFNFSAYWGGGGAFTINNKLITFILQNCNIENCSKTVFPYLYYSYVNDINKNVIIKDNIIKGNITLFRPSEQETDGHGVIINNYI